MRTAALVILTGLLAGCGVELLTTTAIQSELQAEQLSAMKGQISRTADTSAKINIQKAIDTFAAEKGRYPASLEELAPGWLPSVPMRPDGQPYGYDPAAGKLLDGPAQAPAAGPTPADRQKLNDIRAAIDRYGRATGYYPTSLAALAPTYITQVPKTDSGQDFHYDPVTGALRHPLELGQPGAAVAQPPARPMAGAGAAGPMGEVVTGMGVQNQLNSMGQSATSAAGGYARRGVDGATQDHNATQNQVMDNLGL